MPWEAFHLDLHFEVMSVGRVRPSALLGRPDREEAAQTLGPESFGRVEGQWALRMAEYTNFFPLQKSMMTIQLHTSNRIKDG